MAGERIPSIYGEPVWTEADALAWRDFCSTDTGRRLARIVAINFPAPSIGSPEDADRLVGQSAGYRRCAELIDTLRVIPGTLDSDGELVSGAQKVIQFPDIDLPPGDPAWGGSRDPAMLEDLPVGT